MPNDDREPSARWPLIGGLVLLALTITANERISAGWGAPLLLPQVLVLVVGVGLHAARRPDAHAWLWPGALGAAVGLGLTTPLGFLVSLIVAWLAVRSLLRHAAHRQADFGQAIEAPLQWGRAFALADAQTIAATFIGILSYNGGDAGARFAELPLGESLPTVGLVVTMLVVAAALRTRTVWSVMFNLTANALAIPLVLAGVVFVPLVALWVMIATTVVQTWLYGPIVAAVWTRATGLPLSPTVPSRSPPRR